MKLSIVRNIILHRFFNWMKFTFDQISTLDNFKSYNKIKQLNSFMYNNFSSKKYNVCHSNKFGHLLISYVWSNIFTINAKFMSNDIYEENLYCIDRILYKNNIYIPQKFNIVYAWNVEGDNIYIKLFDYVLGTVPTTHKDLKFISDSIDDYEKDLILKLLLFKYVCAINMCIIDVTDLILSVHLELLLLH